MSNQLNILPLNEEHWPRVREIYLHGIATGNATFEKVAPSWEEWNSNHHDFARIVAQLQHEIAGWAALLPVSRRKAYAGVAEVSVYVDEPFRGQGIGTLLLETLINDSERNDVWTLQASIFPENHASIEMHKRCGFRIVGERERIAMLDGIWRNTVLLERRSSSVGL